MLFNLFLFFAFPFFLFCAPPIVLIHIGKRVPSYSEDAIVQAKYFNPESTIYFLLNQEAYENAPYSLENAGASVVLLESLPITPHHKKFLTNSTLDFNYRQGFWTYTSERFFYLDTFMEHYQLSSVFHLEYDNMLYKNLSEILPILKKHYPGCGVTFGFDQFVIPGFVYLANPDSARELANFFARYAYKGWDDMRMLAKYWSSNLNKMDHLPTIPSQYPQLFPLKNANQQTSRFEHLYSKHFNEFKGIFDAAALGQYLGGQDPENGNSSQGFKNTHCLMDLDLCQFNWSLDAQGKKIPIMILQGEKIPIYNLHVHSKNLRLFRSDLESRIALDFYQKKDSLYQHDPIDFVSGQIFQSTCDFWIDEQNQEFPIEKTQFGSLIFVKTDILKYFIKTIHPKIKNPYVLITHNSDIPVTKNYLSLLKDTKLLAWFGQNIDFDHPKLHPLPIGIANPEWPHGNLSLWSKNLELPPLDRNFKIYVNFSPDTHPRRREILKKIDNNPLYCVTESKDLEGYIEDLRSYQFVLSPRGNGLDCHRTWEALYMGAIPIVETSKLDPLFDDLPVIIIDRFEDLTHEYLVEAYENLQKRIFKKDKLACSYWRDLFNSYKHPQKIKK